MPIKRYRLNTYIPFETADIIKEYADKFGITMGGAIAVIINEFKKQQDAMKGISDLNSNLEFLKLHEEKGE